MALFIDVNKFIEETTLPVNTVINIKAAREYIKQNKKGVYSENDTLGKAIASGDFGDIASAHFSRWMRGNYEIGDCDC